MKPRQPANRFPVWMGLLTLVLLASFWLSGPPDSPDPQSVSGAEVGGDKASSRPSTFTVRDRFDSQRTAAGSQRSSSSSGFDGDRAEQMIRFRLNAYAKALKVGKYEKLRQQMGEAYLGGRVWEEERALALLARDNPAMWQESLTQVGVVENADGSYAPRPLSREEIEYLDFVRTEQLAVARRLLAETQDPAARAELEERIALLETPGVVLR